MWRVVIWTNANNGDSTEYDTKSEAYEYANTVGLHAYAVEIYGPDGFYDGVE